jgi:hypothetical protein
MPWREVSIMVQRREFVGLAMQEGGRTGASCAGASEFILTRPTSG